MVYNTKDFGGEKNVQESIYFEKEGVYLLKNIHAYNCFDVHHL